ncbi:hypothetical protein H310_01756 [Aphanomyces invadans]|uniref:Uncharacterized protein n=1 Tax=Aphanomyces invadans TaxID=157072 RepID=A0A024ULR2_9STRA|nr:hypothetical protein H310_01756 [Aphanomyces invadans]ETW07120.1 hypothetical protein H310_01756 [Aphanomyces invadans]|eukprot:XP_008863213.1 hypothetical protein H310_01756 [Aphanomyces invadans]
MAVASGQDDFPFSELQLDDAPTDGRPTTRVPATSPFRPVFTTTFRPIATTTTSPTATTASPFTSLVPTTTTLPQTIPPTTAVPTAVSPRPTTSAAVPTTATTSPTMTTAPIATSTPSMTTSTPTTKNAPLTTSPAPTTLSPPTNHSSHEPLYVVRNSTGNGTNESNFAGVAASPDDIVFCDRVSIERDATYCIRGPICSGRGDSPHGVLCPQAGAVAVAQCLPTLPSYNVTLGQCIARTASVCQKIQATDAWGCVLP